MSDIQVSLNLLRTRKLSNITGTVVAIGNFDGIHRGHQQLLRLALEAAKLQKLGTCLLTFEPYPQVYFQGNEAPTRLTSLREKCFLLQEFGFDYLCGLQFNAALAKLTAEEFIQRVLLQQLQAKHVIIGEDFRFGYQRQGDVNLLKSTRQFQVTAVPTVTVQQHRIGSSWVRNALAEGDLALAENLLGRPYFMMGRVVRGDQRGRQLGFPTANINLHARKAAIKGVYAVKIYGLNNAVLTGVANLGKRPTIDGLANLLEVHIFDFNENIYGKHLRVEFVQKIRDEMRFASLADLQAQIHRDSEAARAIFQ